MVGHCEMKGDGRPGTGANDVEACTVGYISSAGQKEGHGTWHWAQHPCTPMATLKTRFRIS